MDNKHNNLLFAAFALTVWSQGGLGAEPEHLSERKDLLAFLEEQTEIATRTKLNADYVPGMVTVLYGDDMKALGALTVAEALTFVPGIEVGLEPHGSTRLIVRGITSNFSSGHVKLLVDGISMNSAEKGLAEPVFRIPIEQVDRIEVIRGPGSAIHGEYAYVGVINVVTRKSSRDVSVGFAQNNGRSAVGNYAWSSPETNAHLAISVSARRTDGTNRRIERDRLYLTGDSSDIDLSHAPGPANDEARFGSAFVEAGIDDVSLSLYHMEDGFGDHAGLNSFLPPEQDEIVTRHRTQGVELSTTTEVSDELSGTLGIGWQRTHRSQDDLYIAPSAISGLGITPNRELYLDTLYEERQYRLFGSLTWRGTTDHTVLGTVAYDDTRVEDTSRQFNALFPAEHPIQPGQERRTTSLTLQDEYQPTESTTVTAGARYDDYSDVGSRVTPRISWVWRRTGRDVYKLQYASAFRPPTFNETGTNALIERDGTPTPDLAPSTVKTYEAAYIRKGSNSESRITVFHSEFEDNIADDEDTGGFRNAEGARHRGIELEHDRRIGYAWRLEANAAYTDSEELDTGAEIEGTPKWLGNLGLTYRPGPRLMVNLRYRYAGPFARAEGDPRSDLAAYDRLDATLALPGIWKDVSLRAGIQNMFDSKVVDQGRTGDLYDGSVVYDFDTPRDGRLWWLRLSYAY